jgi:hypothetical protein
MLCFTLDRNGLGCVLGDYSQTHPATPLLEQKRKNVEKKFFFCSGVKSGPGRGGVDNGAREGRGVGRGERQSWL